MGRKQGSQTLGSRHAVAQSIFKKTQLRLFPKALTILQVLYTMIHGYKNSTRGETKGRCPEVGVSKAVKISGLLRAHLTAPKHGLEGEPKVQAPTDTAISLLKNLFLSDYLLARPLED